MRLDSPIWADLRGLDRTCRLLLGVGLLEMPDEDRARLPELLDAEGTRLHAQLDQAEKRLADLLGPRDDRPETLE